jgi:hypothetical protein
MKPKRLARSVVQAPSELVELSFGEHREIGAFGHVLAKQAIGVLVGAALPGAVGVTEVDLDPGREVEVAVELLALVQVIEESH